MGTRRGQKPSRFLVAAGGSRGVFLPRVCKIRYLVCMENPFVSRYFFVSNRHCISLSSMVRIRSFSSVS